MKRICFLLIIFVILFATITACSQTTKSKQPSIDNSQRLSEIITELKATFDSAIADISERSENLDNELIAMLESLEKSSNSSYSGSEDAYATALFCEAAYESVTNYYSDSLAKSEQLYQQIQCFAKEYYTLLAMQGIDDDLQWNI